MVAWIPVGSLLGWSTWHHSPHGAITSYTQGDGSRILLGAEPRLFPRGSARYICCGPDNEERHSSEAYLINFLAQLYTDLTHL